MLIYLLLNVIVDIHLEDLSWIQALVFLQLSLSPGGWGTSYKRLMGMCCWMGSHFHDWIDFNGVAYSIELLEWAHIFSYFWGRKVLHIYK